MIGLFTKLLPMKWPIIIAGSLGIIIATFFYGVSFGKAKEEAKLLRAVEVAHEEEQQLQLEQNRAMQEYYEELLGRNIKREVVTKEVIRYVETPAANVECFDDDGVRVVQRILENQMPAAP